MVMGGKWARKDAQHANAPPMHQESPTSRGTNTITQRHGAPHFQVESLHCALLLDYVPPEEPLGMPLGNTLRIRQPEPD